MSNLIVVLGGNSTHNAEWGQALARKLAHYGQVYRHAYHHWESGESDIDFDAELKTLGAYLRKSGHAYCIVAKSAGALLALKGIAKGALAPSSLVCLGLPLSYAAHRSMPIQETVKKNTVPTLYMQAEHDPVGSGEAVASMTAGYGTCKIIAGNSHGYNDLDMIVNEAVAFFGVHKMHL